MTRAVFSLGVDIGLRGGVGEQGECYLGVKWLLPRATAQGTKHDLSTCH